MQAKAAIEAIIFAVSEPIGIKNIAEIIGISEHTVKQIITDLIDEYRREGRGIQISSVANGYQFCTHPECAPYLEKLQKAPRNVGLTQAAIETLAIIAYKQPITKGEIEALRGVSIESPLNTLVDKQLVEEAGRKDVPGRPILYRTSQKFLKYFGLNNLTQLPAIPEWINPNEISFNSETVEAKQSD
ncbi:MAG TPA: SMC-Scp complex subunit ScpB [Bacillota bacterium]|nr:SMC-Scp complex subunit ScpB [Bacillota bacterium]